MMRAIASAAWAESPARVIAAVLLTPVAVAAVWLATVVVIVAGTPA